MDFTNLPIDPIVILLVLLAGQFQKHYLEDLMPNKKSAFKTLVTSFVFVLIYGLLFWVAGDFTKEMPGKWFLSYTVATSLYELLLKKFLDKYFPADAVKILVLIIGFSWLSGCSVVKKNHTLKEDISVSDRATHTDSAHVIAMHTNLNESIDSTAIKQYLQTRQSSLSIVFDTSDHADYSSPVTIEKKDGKMILNTGGRRIAGATFNDMQHTEGKDSSASSGTRQLTQGWIDSFTHSSDSIANEWKKDKQQTDSSSKKSSVAWGIAIGFLIAVAIAACWLYKKMGTLS